MRFSTRILGAATTLVLAMSGIGFAATPALATPDPDLFPTVEDGPTVVTNITSPAGAQAAALLVNQTAQTLPAGTARVLHGQYVNQLSEDVCVYASAQSIGYFSMTGTGVANLTVIESEGLPIPDGVLPVTGASSLTRSYPVSTETGPWECDFGTPLAAGATLDYSVTVGVPVGGTPITATNLRVTVRVEVARQPPSEWDDNDYNSGFMLGPFSVNASAPQTSWGLTRLISDLTASPGDAALIAGRALGAYGSFTNNLPYPIRVNYAGFQTNGALARFVVSDLADWTDGIRLEPGQSTPMFFMALGAPNTLGNEMRGTETTFQFAWTVTQVGDPFTVTFNANGGLGSMADQTADTPTALTTNTFTRAGYTFAGWNTNPTGVGTAYADGATFPFSANTTLYAQWTLIPVPHTVTFNANGGSGNMVDQTDATPTALSPNTFSRIGYTFAGWNTVANGSGTNYADGAVFSFGADTTLYAQWTLIVTSHTVTFNANGGTGSMANQSASEATALRANTFSRSGYTFTGWNTSADGSGTAFANTAVFSFGNDLALYAQWKKNDDGGDHGGGDDHGGGGSGDLVNTGGTPVQGFLVSFGTLLLTGGFGFLLLKKRRRREES